MEIIASIGKNTTNNGIIRDGSIPFLDDYTYMGFLVLSESNGEIINAEITTF